MIRFFTFIGLLSLALNLWADTDKAAGAQSGQSLNAQGWYERMLEHSPSANYSGIFVHQAGNQTQSVEIVHGMNDGEIWERLLHLDGQVREVIRRGDDLYCIHPDSSVEQVQQQGSSPFGNKPQGDFNQLARAYDFRLLGKQRIAGRLVIGVQLVPKDKIRHAYQLWIDVQTSVPLRTELITLSGNVLERYQFSYFKESDGFKAAHFEPKNKGAKLELAKSSEVLQAREGDVLEWRLNWMPSGFLDQAAKGHAPKLSARRMYSDGIVMFSVYVEGVEKVQDEGTAQAGPTVLAVQHKQWQGRTHRITVVGEIPAQTATKIAQSVELL